ncbi:MAG: hypothetical protein P4M14_13210 [Gammaproteobacteria bacterium]|nr:hypothetical protein [Gammaproteobacteria bacterium]
MPNQVQAIKGLIQEIERYRVILQAEAGLRGPAHLQPELNGTPVILDGLRKLSGLAEEAKLSDEQEKEAIAKVEELRRHLLLMLKNEHQSKLKKEFYDALFRTQILLATYWPVNGKDPESGLCEDPFFIEDPFKWSESVIAVSSGHWFDKKGLADYYSRNNAFVMEGNAVYVRDPYQTVVSEREIAYMHVNGVKIPRPDQNLLAVNRAFGLGGQRVDGAPDAEQRRLQWHFALSLATLRGALAGVSIGAFLGTVATIILLVFCPPLPLLGTLTLFGTSLASGFIEARRGENGFWHGLKSSLFANMMLITITSFAAPHLLVALFTYNIISAAAASSAMGGLIVALSALPVATFLIGSLRECFKPGALSRFYHGISVMPTYLLAVTCGLIGGVVGLTLGGIANVFSGPVPAPAPRQLENENPLLDEHDAEPAQRQGQGHAAILNGLGVDPEYHGHGEDRHLSADGVEGEAYDAADFEIEHARAAAEQVENHDQIIPAAPHFANRKG